MPRRLKKLLSLRRREEVSEHERDYGLGMDALVSVGSRNTNESMVWHGCSGHRMLWEHERDYGFGMDAVVIVCSGNTNEIMVWAWMLWSSYALGTRTRLWFGHGCSGHRMLWEHERDYGLGMDALVIVCSGNTNEIMVWHGCSGHRMRWEHERDYGLGMDARVIVCVGNTNEIMVWAWMLWSSYALGTRTGLWFGHGSSFRRMLWEHPDIGNAALAAPKGSWLPVEQSGT